MLPTLSLCCNARGAGCTSQSTRARPCTHARTTVCGGTSDALLKAADGIHERYKGSGEGCVEACTDIVQATQRRLSSTQRPLGERCLRTEGWGQGGSYGRCYFATQICFQSCGVEGYSACSSRRATSCIHRKGWSCLPVSLLQSRRNCGCSSSAGLSGDPSDLLPQQILDGAGVAIKHCREFRGQASQCSCILTHSRRCLLKASSLGRHIRSQATEACAEPRHLTLHCTAKQCGKRASRGSVGNIAVVSAEAKTAQQAGNGRVVGGHICSDRGQGAAEGQSSFLSPHGNGSLPCDRCTDTGHAVLHGRSSGSQL